APATSRVSALPSTDLAPRPEVDPGIQAVPPVGGGRVTRLQRFWRVWQPARGERPGPMCVQEVVLTTAEPRARSGADVVSVVDLAGRSRACRTRGLRVEVVEVAPRGGRA